MTVWEVVYVDVLDWAASYDGEPFHAVLCDPPYDYQFMGKDWDDAVAMHPETWAALAEHLHPGAFIMAFAGARTYHRLAVALEDAGLVIHPALGWLNGQGFPKATRIDTQVDKIAGAGREVVEKKRTSALTSRPGWRKNSPRGIDDSVTPVADKYVDGMFNVTAPATDLARTWQGHRYGKQSLKPSIEFIALAQKPYEGKPVESITATGAGALWIDGGRIGTNESTERTQNDGPQWSGKFNGGRRINGGNSGRWPANFALVHVSLPVMRVCSTIPPEIESKIRRYFNDYTNLSALREKHRDAPMENQQGAKVLQHQMCGGVEKGQSASRTQAEQSDIDLSAVQSRVQGMESVGEERPAQVLQLGLQDSLPEDADGGKECQVWGIAHGQDKGKDASGTPDNQGEEQPQLDGWKVSDISRLQVCSCGELGPRDTCACGVYENEIGLHSGASLGDGSEIGTSVTAEREGSSYQWQQSRQQIRELNDPGQSSAFEETQRDGSQNWEARTGSGMLEVLACDVPEKWLDYFEYTKENLGCVRDGVRRVTGNERPNCEGKSYGKTGAVLGKFADDKHNVRYTDPDGTESVANWQCVDGCPVKALGEHSGTLQSGKMPAGTKRRNAMGYQGAMPDRTLNGTIGDKGTAARFYHNADWSHEIAEQIAEADAVRYQAKTGRKERNSGLERFSDKPYKSNAMPKEGSIKKYGLEEAIERMKEKCVNKNNHPTVKPIALTKWLATLLLPPPEYAPRRILVPFAGSGSEAIGALLAGWDEVVGVELSQDYCDIAHARLTWWEQQAATVMFNDVGQILKAAT